MLSVLLAAILVAIPQTATVDQAARTAFFDRLLYPQAGPAVPGPSQPPDKNQQKTVEAAAAYQKGLLFTQQGAWREAQSAFRDAERRNDKVPGYRYAAAFSYLKTHKPQDAYKRYEHFYKQNPADARALAGMIAAREEAQFYRDAAALWMRYVRLPLPPRELAEARAMLAGARELFSTRYEIAENPTGGAANIATPAEELELGMAYAKELASSGVPLLQDKAVVAYVAQLSQRLVSHAKQFPTNYELYVLDTAGVNATTVPGFIFVYRGLLEAAPSEAALAGVLAHEIGHSVAHHGAKKVTKSYQDRKQLESLKGSDSKLSRFLAKMLEAGNPVGALEFSRAAEAQADRLAVHITFDTGFDPNGLAEMFQVFEQMSPSSRNSWDLMARTHPFSIDRVNAVREYAVLLPERPLATSTPAFVKIKARLAALPPAPDATGMLKPPAPSAPPPAAPPARSGRIPFTIDTPDFSGEMPEGWVARRTDEGIVIIEGAPGTEAYEMTIRLVFSEKGSATLDDVASSLREALQKLPGATVTIPELERTSEGRPARALVADYTGQDSSGRAGPFRQVIAAVEYAHHVVVVGYSGPSALHDKYAAAFKMVGSSLRERR